MSAEWFAGTVTGSAGSLFTIHYDDTEEYLNAWDDAVPLGNMRSLTGMPFVEPPKLNDRVEGLWVNSDGSDSDDQDEAHGARRRNPNWSADEDKLLLERHAEFEKLDPNGRQAFAKWIDGKVPERNGSAAVSRLRVVKKRTGGGGGGGGATDAAPPKKRQLVDDDFKASAKKSKADRSNRDVAAAASVVSNNSTAAAAAAAVSPPEETENLVLRNLIKEVQAKNLDLRVEVATLRGEAAGAALIAEAHAGALDRRVLVAEARANAADGEAAAATAQAHAADRRALAAEARANGAEERATATEARLRELQTAEAAAVPAESPTAAWCNTCSASHFAGDPSSVTLGCGHSFCRRALEQWRAGGGADCPQC
jgi:hypothetical protein